MRNQRPFTPEEIQEIRENKYVSKCSAKSITYTSEFRLFALQRYQEGLTPSMIFKEAGFNTKVLGVTRMDDCLKRWRKKARIHGEESLAIDGRGEFGGRPKTKELTTEFTKEERIEYLEATVAYLKAENDFLVKRRKELLK